MTFGSVFFGNSKGTLNNDMSINNHLTALISLYTILMVPLSNRFKLTTLAMCILKPWMQRQNLLFMILKASYVRAVADQTATAGYVKTNTAYTITYQ